VFPGLTAGTMDTKYDLSLALRSVYVLIQSKLLLHCADIIISTTVLYGLVYLRVFREKYLSPLLLLLLLLF